MTETPTPSAEQPGTKRNRTKRPIVEQPSDLVPLAYPRDHGLPMARRTLGRLIATGQFVPVVKFGGRLYARRGDIEDYKARLFPNVQPVAAE